MAKAWVVDKRAVQYLLFGKIPTSDIVPIYPALRRRAERVAAAARIYVGKDTGALSRSISVSDTRLPGGWNFQVLADKPYALHHHRGTKPHVIKGPVRFPGRGGIVTAVMVDHPGTRPNPFLKEALDEFLSTRDRL